MDFFTFDNDGSRAIHKSIIAGFNNDLTGAIEVSQEAGIAESASFSSQRTIAMILGADLPPPGGDEDLEFGSTQKTDGKTHVLKLVVQ